VAALSNVLIAVGVKSRAQAVALAYPDRLREA